MSTFLKCKICGGDLGAIDSDIAVCQYCGTKQILPKMTSERKANLYDRANHYRSQNEFDKAFGIYEQIVAEDATDAEVYWDLVLCRYGVEYVEDPTTKKRIPTVNRTQYQSIFEDVNYKAALEHASAEQKEIIEADAALIDRIQRDILDLSGKEQPYDIFICYKETDNAGRRTPDSVIAQDMYSELTKEGYRVFFSRITLEDKLGTAYEPYIFAALNSSKVMIAVGTKAEYFNAVWVKNEWSRYLGLINAGEKKILIPAYKDMDPYDLPEEFSHLQAQDMGKLGFMQDLVRGINKIIKPASDNTTASSSGIDVVAYKKRIAVFLENGDFKSAREYCDKLLDVLPEDAETYIYRLCAELKINQRSELGQATSSFGKKVDYQNALKFASQSEREELSQALDAVEQTVKKIKKRKRRFGCVLAMTLVLLTTAGIVTKILVDKQKEKELLAEKARIIAEVEQYADDGEFEEAYAIILSDGDKFDDNTELVDYINAGCLYLQKDFEGADAYFSNHIGYKNSDYLDLECQYYLLEGNIETADPKELQKQLDLLLERGVEDVDNIAPQILYKVLDKELSTKLEANNIVGMYAIINRWKEDYPEITSEYLRNNQEKWYKEALNLCDNAHSDEELKRAYSYFNCLLEGYKDSDVYAQLLSSESFSSYIGSNKVISSCFSHLELKVSHSILWKHYHNWLEGTEWKTADRSKYFKMDDEGYIGYNLPFIEHKNSYYAIDIDGILYIYDQSDAAIPPVSRTNEYKFEIVNESQMKVHCYKDDSDYVLYKQ